MEWQRRRRCSAWERNVKPALLTVNQTGHTTQNLQTDTKVDLSAYTNSTAINLHIRITAARSRAEGFDGSKEFAHQKKVDYRRWSTRESTWQTT